MKIRLLLLFMLSFSVSVFSQKKELKTAEKSLKKEKYTEALEQLKVVDPMLADMDAKLKEKYYYIKAKALRGDGKNWKNDKPAARAYKELIEFEKENNLKKYLKEAEAELQKYVQKFAASGSKFYKEKNYKNASFQFETVYALSSRDTSFLDNAALSAFLDKDYDKSIRIYKKLLELGYTGIATQYRAKSAINGEYMYFSSQKEMNNQVVLKAATNPEVYQTESRAGDVVKNIALSYIAKGDEQGALKAIGEAKKLYPNDYTLIISEANIYYKLGDNEKFLEGLRKAIELRPDDPLLFYNVGVLTLEQGYIEESIKAFEKAIELKPDYADAYNNIGVAILEKTKPIIEEMNENLSNFKKYDELNEKQKVVYKEALPYFEKTLELKPQNENTLSTLVGLYELLEMYDKQKEMKARLDAL
ncbi:tetratricopeptide repeat protein [Flavicella marina]|uniref:tetratricopeptide repeat protein n=1 Tax=Flavicella marina TaxID=1475951 RepID=UPI00186B1FAA|nr:tetratricopeptide repeat protein [Flavicella marina]